MSDFRRSPRARSPARHPDRRRDGRRRPRRRHAVAATQFSRQPDDPAAPARRPQHPSCPPTPAPVAASSPAVAAPTEATPSGTGDAAVGVATAPDRRALHLRRRRSASRSPTRTARYPLRPSPRTAARSASSRSATASPAVPGPVHAARGDAVPAGDPRRHPRRRAQPGHPAPAVRRLDPDDPRRPRRRRERPPEGLLGRRRQPVQAPGRPRGRAAPAA